MSTSIATGNGNHRNPYFPKQVSDRVDGRPCTELVAVDLRSFPFLITNRTSDDSAVETVLDDLVCEALHA